MDNRTYSLCIIVAVFAVVILMPMSLQPSISTHQCAPEYKVLASKLGDAGSDALEGLAADVAAFVANKRIIDVDYVGTGSAMVSPFQTSAYHAVVIYCE